MPDADDQAHLDEFAHALIEHERALVWEATRRVEGDRAVEQRFDVTLRSEEALRPERRRRVPAVAHVSRRAQGERFLFCRGVEIPIPQDEDMMDVWLGQISRGLVEELEALPPVAP